MYNKLRNNQTKIKFNYTYLEMPNLYNISPEAQGQWDETDHQQGG